MLKQMEKVSNLGKKLANLPEPTLSFSICCWSDLLGFGAPFFESNWKPPVDTWKRVADRITNAHIQCYNNLEPLHEFVLTLNDGIVRCCNPDNFAHLDFLSMWLRACIWTHNAICDSENTNNLPGARTILTAGSNLRYVNFSVTLDDFVYTYTKPDPNKPGTYAQLYGDPIVAINPGPIQMNLAFSRAYILESFGSSCGIAGPHFFVDESFLECVKDITTRLRPDITVIERTQGDFYLFAVPKTRDETIYHLGFDLSLNPIVIDTPKISSNVWRVYNFYPWDEEVSDFKNPVN